MSFILHVFKIYFAGENKIEVECCNILKKCSWKEADEHITVEPVDQTGVLNVIDQMLPQLLMIGKRVNLLNIINNTNDLYYLAIYCFFIAYYKCIIAFKKIFI